MAWFATCQSLSIFFHNIALSVKDQIGMEEGASLVAQMVKNLPTMWESWV